MDILVPPILETILAVDRSIPDDSNHPQTYFEVSLLKRTSC